MACAISNKIYSLYGKKILQTLYILFIQRTISLILILKNITNDFGLITLLLSQMSEWINVLLQNTTVHICSDWQRPLWITRKMRFRAGFWFGRRRFSGYGFPCKVDKEWCLLLACIRHLMLMTVLRPSSFDFVSRRFISTSVCLSHTVSFPLCHTGHS